MRRMLHSIVIGHGWAILHDRGLDIFHHVLAKAPRSIRNFNEYRVFEGVMSAFTGASRSRLHRNVETPKPLG